MEKEKLYIFLDIVVRNGSIERLVRLGVSYEKIASITKYSIENGLIDYQEGQLGLTDKGNEVYRQLGDDHKRTNKELWIEKDIKSQEQKIDKNRIFVPKRNELTF
jgi:predicted transcriptional regulator